MTKRHKHPGLKEGSCPATGPSQPMASGQGTTFNDHSLVKVNPLNQQFEPTEASPIQQNKRMSGVS